MNQVLRNTMKCAPDNSGGGFMVIAAERRILVRNGSLEHTAC